MGSDQQRRAGARRRATGKSAADAAGRAMPGLPRASLYQEVTNRIVAELDAGRFPWVQPWGPVAGGDDRSPDGGLRPGLPRNALTGRPYSGVNIQSTQGLW